MNLSIWSDCILSGFQSYYLKIKSHDRAKRISYSNLLIKQNEYISSESRLFRMNFVKIRYSSHISIFLFENSLLKYSCQMQDGFPGTRVFMKFRILDDMFLIILLNKVSFLCAPCFLIKGPVWQQTISESEYTECPLSQTVFQFKLTVNSNANFISIVINFELHFCAAPFFFV